MATVEQCEQALHDLARRTDGQDAAGSFRRSLSYTVTDLQVIFRAELRDGRLEDIAQAADAAAQIALTSSGDDLVALVSGELAVTGALTSGRLKIKAGMLDLLKLKSIF